MISRHSFLVFFILSITGFAVSGQATGTKAPGSDTAYVRKCNDFKITGDGTSEEWNRAEWISLTPQEGASSNYKTKARILYSARGIYFLFNCTDNKIISTMTADNLNLWEEDVVEVFLWPDESFPVYFEYELSPRNFELPIIVPNKNGDFLGWLPWHYEGEKKTKHATAIKNDNMQNGEGITGWTAEFFIPFRLLEPLINEPPVAGSRWRANLYRIDYDNGIVPFSWQKTEKTFHEYKKFGTIIFR